MIKRLWNYLLSHTWSKDFLRANLLFIVLVLVYNVIHFRLNPINFHFFIRALLLMNICLVINRLLDAYEKTKNQQQ